MVYKELYRYIIKTKHKGTKEFIMTSTFTLPTVESPERYNFKKIPV
jgi:hypothetical protein